MSQGSGESEERMPTRIGNNSWCSRLKRGLGTASLAGAVLFGSGCTVTGPLEWIKNGFKVGPNYSRPPAPVGEEWIEGKDPRTQGPPPRDGDWWTVFQDPT